MCFNHFFCARKLFCNFVVNSDRHCIAVCNFHDFLLSLHGLLFAHSNPLCFEVMTYLKSAPSAFGKKSSNLQDWNLTIFNCRMQVNVTGALFSDKIQLCIPNAWMI